MSVGRIASMALAVATLAAPALAGTVFDNPSDGFACSPTCWTSTFGADATGGYQAFGDFVLGSSAAIRSVTWTGFYINGGGGTNPPTPTTTSWNLDFYGTSGSGPGSLLSSTSILSSNVSATFLGDVSGLGFTVSWYRFSAVLPTAFDATGGTTYWFSPISEQATFEPFFSWSSDGNSSDPLGTWQQGLGGTTNPGGFPPTEVGADGRAFSLSTSAPEPATWSLMLAGVGAAGGALRARRRAARAAALTG